MLRNPTPRLLKFDGLTAVPMSSGAGMTATRAKSERLTAVYRRLLRGRNDMLGDKPRRRPTGQDLINGLPHGWMGLLPVSRKAAEVQSGFCGFGPVQDDEDNTAT